MKLQIAWRISAEFWKGSQINLQRRNFRHWRQKLRSLFYIDWKLYMGWRYTNSNVIRKIDKAIIQLPVQNGKLIYNGELCAICGKNPAADSEKVVFIKKIDSAKKISKLAQISSQISADNLDLIDAVIELDRKQNILFNVVAAMNKSLEELKNANS